MHNGDLHNIYCPTDITGSMSSGIPEGRSGCWRKIRRTFSRHGNSSESPQLINPATRRNMPENLNTEKQNCSITLLGPATPKHRGDADEKYTENFGEAN
jgi:hypothetical protein